MTDIITHLAEQIDPLLGLALLLVWHLSKRLEAKMDGIEERLAETNEKLEEQAKYLVHLKARVNGHSK